MGASRSDGWLHSVMAGTCSVVEPRFLVGDLVGRASRVPPPKGGGSDGDRTNRAYYGIIDG
jgi:hypothetical protein